MKFPLFLLVLAFALSLASCAQLSAPVKYFAGSSQDCVHIPDGKGGEDSVCTTVEVDR